MGRGHARNPPPPSPTSPGALPHLEYSQEPASLAAPPDGTHLVVGEVECLRDDGQRVVQVALRHVAQQHRL
eukprot:scaffold31968_cov101-Isochrysis_galbana.AAC.3